MNRLLKNRDLQIYNLIKNEYNRQKIGLELIDLKILLPNLLCSVLVQF